jgi:hypothetical protein
MRVTTLVFLLIIGGLIALGIVFHSWVFARVDSFNQWRSGFGPAQTPTEAIEKFRDAIQKRKYVWAANYCTADYAEMLRKSDTAAARLGGVVDKIRTYMQNNKLQTDQSLALLAALDPFPANFKVSGVVKTIGDKDATGLFVWEPLPYQNANFSVRDVPAQIDVRMFDTNLVASALFSSSGFRLVKDGDAWKINVTPTAGDVEKNRYLLDHWQTYESELGTFRTYMTNGRYDSARAFETEMLDSLKKAK